MIVHFNCGDTLQMKKKHPCSGDLFLVLRVGSDIRIQCKKCGRDLTIPRVKIESSIKKVISNNEQEAEHGSHSST